MDRKYVLFAGLALAAGGDACAQNIEWRQAVYAEVLRVDHGGAVEQVPFYPYWSELELPQRVMQVSQQGTPGIVLAGGAQIGDGDALSAPTTPYVTKLDSGDGHVLWTWQPQPDAPPLGRVRWSALDVSGAIFVAGTLQTDATEQPRSLLAKLDGATGAELWRVTGDESTTAYGVVLDAAGGVIVTSSEPDEGQRVSKYAAFDGSPIWSHVLAGGLAWFGDFRLAVRPDGDILVAGSGNEAAIFGVQVARLHADDGAEEWRCFPSNTKYLEEADVLLVLGDDILVASRSGRVRVSGDDCSVIWQRQEFSSEFRSFDALVDSAGRLFVAGSNHIDNRAVVRRYDPATGDTIWEAAINTGPPYPASAFLITLANDGSLLSAWYTLPVGAADVDAESGAVAWSRELDTLDLLEFPVGIVPAPDGSTYVGAFPSVVDQSVTWIVFKLGNTPVHTVTPSAGANGSIAPNTPQIVTDGDTTSFAVTPDGHYRIADVTGCGGELDGSTYTTGPVTADCTVSATFEILTHTVTPSAGDGSQGTIAPNMPQTVDDGDTMTFTITPLPPYLIDVVTGCNGTLEGNVYTTGAVTADCTVIATFTLDETDSIFRNGFDP